ncbi:hypothetical protein AAH979_12085 [Plantactinospora sp. ZYX-F-223]|uniref:LppU/SCO3897 family protein n=1 Tax=Plantactinospora sp. ZYX-F-223 TaxID=3144103 RepID=UPI0031FDB606
MSIYGTPAGGQPEDPDQSPSSGPPAGGDPPPPPGTPPPSPGYPPAPDAGYPPPPPAPSYPPPGYPPPVGTGAGQPSDAPSPGWGQPPSGGGAGSEWGPPPSGGGPNPAWGQPPTSGGPNPAWGQPPTSGGPSPEWGQPQPPTSGGPNPEWGQPPSGGGAYQPGYPGATDQPQSGPPGAPYGGGGQYQPPGAPYGGPGAPGAPGAPYGPPGAPLGPAGAPPKSGGGLKIALIVGGIVLLLLCACGGIGIWWAVDQSGDDSDPGIGAPAPTSSARSTPSRPASTPSSSSERYVKGDCLVNDGTDDEPELRKVACGPGTYEVLSRIPFTTDPKQCENDPIFGSPEADANYVQDDPLDLGDFVLCLKRR